MNIDKPSQVVRSRYFVGKPAMDESLSDFQESKQNCKGPKAVQKTTKPKSRNVKKRIIGQKDIRTALKGKKNELISYAKEFDTICKKSGLDIDSEQLQLAIALSKSLHTGVSDDASTSQALTTQGRIAKIKTTLQEYGFKVPESKITTTNNRKRKHRREFKLLNTTKEERDQKISSKYSQILFENLDCSNLDENCVNLDSNTPIYNIGTHLEYTCMRDNSIFYVDNLVEKSITSGSLFRDWSEIPGRPISPVFFDTSPMNFSEILCSQEELDVILSGYIKSAKHIINAKEHNMSKGVIDCEGEGDKQISNNIESNIPDVINKDIPVIQKDIKVINTPKKAVKENDALEIKYLEINSTSTREQYRSCSPDIFDDEDSSIIESLRPVVSLQGQNTKVITDDTMDLTECATNVLLQNVEKPHITFLNITKRKSDDFMEMTECAVTASQGIREDEKEIDLTQSPDDKSVKLATKPENSCYIVVNPDYSINEKDEVITARHFENEGRHRILQDDIDLTQSSNDSSIILGENNQATCNATVSDNFIDRKNATDLVIEVEFKENHKSSKDDVDLTQDFKDEEIKTIFLDNSNLTNNKSETMDLTQSSKSSADNDELPEVILENTQTNQSDLDNTIILSEEEYKNVTGKVMKSIIIQDEQVFDLTQDGHLKPNEKTKEESPTLCSKSFYEDFEYDHSGNKDNVDDIEMCDDKKSCHNTSKEKYDVDLTQSSDESTRHCTSPIPVTTFENISKHNSSSLGKRDEVSIDYDEICEYESDKESNSNITEKDSLSLKYNSVKSLECNNLEDVDGNNDLVSNSSQHSEVFDLTDKELDYSLHKSRHDVPIDNYNFDFGGISVMDDITGVQCFKQSLDKRTSNNYNLGETFLPEVHIKKTEEKCINSEDLKIHQPSAHASTKIENIPNTVPIVTPKNREYIVKTDNVTPMLDYASLTTPQRNKELDRYGLKPFKRKRAIQILTHLYNQTHPVVESYLNEDLPSPSKKPRQDTNKPLNISPRRTRLKASQVEKLNTNMDSPQKEPVSQNSKSPGTSNKINTIVNSPKKEGNSSKESIDYVVTSEVPSIRGVDCHPDDWVFQKREKAKVHSCRVPLHIAFHNYVSSRRDLREAILKYEPVNIDVIHKDLVSYGHRYDPKDLLRFLDKKCITVKTSDNNSRNKR